MKSTHSVISESSRAPHSATENRSAAGLGRRGFCATLVAGLGLTAMGSTRALTAEPPEHKGGPRLRLGLAAYSFRQFFKDSDDSDAKAAENRNLDMIRFIDFCAENGCDGAELTSYYFPKNLDNDYLMRVKRHAFIRGVSISGTAIGNVFTHPAGAERQKQLEHTKLWIDHAAAIGAPHIRIFAGEVPKGLTREEARKNAIEATEEACDYAGKKGVYLGIENHGGIVSEADDLLAIVKAVKSPWLGINLDTGNFHTADPYGDLAKCAPYSVNVQVKVLVHARGGKPEAADMVRLGKILKDAQYQGFVTLEYEDKEDPWTAVPRHLDAIRKQLIG